MSISMNMDKNTFNGLVDSLLEPKIKTAIQLKRKHYGNETTSVKDTSLRGQSGEYQPLPWNQ